MASVQALTIIVENPVQENLFHLLTYSDLGILNLKPKNLKLYVNSNLLGPGLTGCARV